MMSGGVGFRSSLYFEAIVWKNMREKAGSVCRLYGLRKDIWQLRWKDYGKF